jgi:hypothetical protein
LLKNIGCGLIEVLVWHSAGRFDENHETHQDSRSLDRELNHGPLELKAGSPHSWLLYHRIPYLIIKGMTGGWLGLKPGFVYPVF